jgi:polyhydroxybutyrate depolymerase
MCECLWRAVLAATAIGCGSNTFDPSSDATAGGGDAAHAVDAATTAGCGQAGATTGAINGTIEVAGTARTYVLVVPASYDAGRAYPLIFAWHGRTGTAATARLYFGIEVQAGADAIVVYPQGLPVTSDPNDTGWELTAAGRDVALFDALQAELAATYCIGRTYSMGHSFGGYMSNALACFRGGRAAGAVRAIASIAGGGPFGTCSGDPVSAVLVHGTNDQVVPVAQGVASRDRWRGEAGCATTAMPVPPSPCIAYDGCATGLSVRWCEHADTANAGHGWPSFAAAASWQLFVDSP